MNLFNDPLNNDTCKHIILKNQFTNDYKLKTSWIKNVEDELIHEEDLEFKEWEEDQNNIIKKSFFDLLEDLNKDNIFYFGCPFNNYKENYSKRVEEFLIKFKDTSVEDFISYEINFLENILIDIQNSENANDAFPHTGKIIFNKAYSIVSLIGYEQFYYSTIKKIKYLEQRKIDVKSPKKIYYNDILLACESPEIQELFINILHNGISLFNAINQINKITTPETYILFLYEFETIYNHLLCSFMSSIEVSTIEQALEIYEDELEFVYVAEEDLPHLGPFLRDIGKHKTVYNSFGLNSTEDDNAIKIVHLNNLMIDYYNGFFESPRKGFEHMIALRVVYKYLNNDYLNKYFGKTTLNTDITKILTVDNAPNKNIIENILVDEIENDFLKSTIEEHLEEFEDDIMHNGYKILVDALYQYFSCNKFPVLKSKIKFKSINKKRVGWALKELYKCEKRENLDIEYFRFAQENINLFANEIIEKENFYRSNFYKMFTTNPAK